jgi:uncharacterized protein
MAQRGALLEELLSETAMSSTERDFAVGLLFLYGMGVSRDHGKALELFHRAARHACPWAQYALGYMYETGKSAPRDFKQAFKWYFEAAKQSHPAAMCIVGLMYRHGKGVDKNPSEAFNWLSRSAEASYSLGAVQLAECYELGIGVSKSEESARHWYLRAVDIRDSNSPVAYAAMSLLYREGRLGFPLDTGEAESWYKRSAESRKNIENLNEYDDSGNPDH